MQVVPSASSTVWDVPPILANSLLRTLSLRGDGRARIRRYFFTTRPEAERKGDGVETEGLLLDISSCHVVTVQCVRDRSLAWQANGPE